MNTEEKVYPIYFKVLMYAKGDQYLLGYTSSPTHDIQARLNEGYPEDSTKNIRYMPMIKGGETQ